MGEQNNLAYEMLTAEFPDSQVKSFNQAKPGQPPRWLSYVEDETVMDRLDTVFGPGNWNVNVEVAASGVAIVRLGVKWPDNGEWTVYSDFGYPTNGDRGEALKEAVSDGIRRAARFLGVARYIYAGHVDASPAGRAPSAPAAQPRSAAPSGGAGPADSEWGDIDAALADVCPIHNVEWRTWPDGNRSHKQDGKWCYHPDNKRTRR